VLGAYGRDIGWGGVALEDVAQVFVDPHGVTSQKTPFFIVTAVKTSNLI
jgi:hypothetical protein